MIRARLAALLNVTWALLLAGFGPVPMPDIQRVAGRSLPNVSFQDDVQRWRKLSSLGGQPLIVVPTYTTCHASCPMLVAGLKRGLLEADLDVRTFQVFLFSFDEGNTPAELAAFRRAHQLPASWVVARLERDAIRALTQALDYRTLRQQGAWVHPNAVGFVSPDQRIAKFLYGVSFSGREIRNALSVAREATDWSTRMAPWALSLGMVGLTLSTVVFVHLLGARKKRNQIRLDR